MSIPGESSHQRCLVGDRDVRKTSGGSPTKGCSVGKMPGLGRILGVRCLVAKDRVRSDDGSNGS